MYLKLNNKFSNVIVHKCETMGIKKSITVLKCLVIV